MPLLRRFWDSPSGTCSYLVGSDATRQAVFIDPVREQVPLYLGVLEELGLRLAGIIETHVHADHLTAADTLRRLTGATVVCGRQSGVEGADCLLADGDSLNFGDLAFQALSTPGHTPACLTYRWGDRLFTGDSLLISGCGRTDGPGGNAGMLFDSVTRRLLTQPDEYLVYPGHGSQQRWVSCIGEERRTNPMLLGVSRDEFIALASRRELPPLPARAETLAANRRCGRLPEEEAEAAPESAPIPDPEESK
ncbi:MAG: Zn-dependent hydrolase, glyoxylase [Rhodocyclaceae bacterium]|nr:Zn-dependent hydrolase, glyoxylase [Rhodocyclaceae bacterium]